MEARKNGRVKNRINAPALHLSIASVTRSGNENMRGMMERGLEEIETGVGNLHDLWSMLSYNSEKIQSG